MNYSDYKKRKVLSKTEYIHSQKLKQLLPRERETKSLNRNWIKNLSSRSLTNAQESLLKKENKFAIAPSKIPVLDIIYGVELGLNQVNFADKCSIDSARCKVVEILKRAKPPKLNLSKAEKRAMEELKQYDNIVILNADKGNNTVVMDKLEYDKKLLGLLSDSATYKVISKNPICSIKKRLNRYIWKLYKNDKISTHLCKTWRSGDLVLPRIYGLPKSSEHEIEAMISENNDMLTQAENTLKQWNEDFFKHILCIKDVSNIKESLINWNELRVRQM